MIPVVAPTAVATVLIRINTIGTNNGIKDSNAPGTPLISIAMLRRNPAHDMELLQPLHPRSECDNISFDKYSLEYAIQAIVIGSARTIVKRIKLPHQFQRYHKLQAVPVLAVLRSV